MPLGEMRRRDRQMSEQEAEGLLRRALVGRIGSVDRDGMPYVLPMSFYYDAERKTVLMHHSLRGHLLENLAQNPAACFEVDEAGPVVATGPRSCDTSQLYSSVICFGTARIVESRAEKEDALNLLVRKYVAELTPQREYDAELAGVEATTVIALEVGVITGKQRLP